MVDDMHKMETQPARSLPFEPENRDWGDYSLSPFRAHAEKAATKAPDCVKARKKLPSAVAGLLESGADRHHAANDSL